MEVANKYFLCSLSLYWLESTGFSEIRYLLICKYCLCWASACLLSDPGMLLGSPNVGVGESAGGAHKVYAKYISNSLQPVSRLSCQLIST